jgi:hypothetical protein
MAAGVPACPNSRQMPARRPPAHTGCIWQRRTADVSAAHRLAFAAQVERPRVLEWDESREGLINGGFSYAFNNGWVPGTLGTSLANSSNAVMRT